MADFESEEGFPNLKAVTSLLDHARTMANHSAEIRMRNFNFFILITAALVAGLAKAPSSWGNLIFEVAGILSSLLFLGLDMRGYVLLMYNTAKGEQLEAMLWQIAGIGGLKPKPPHGGNRFLTHRWLYRAFFVIVGVGWIAVLVASLMPGAKIR